MLKQIGYTLTGSVITKDPAFNEQVMAYPHIERLNIGPVSTMKISWDQPHEGNLFEFLWQRRSIERAWGCETKFFECRFSAGFLRC